VLFTGSEQGSHSLPKHRLDYRSSGGYIVAAPSVINGRTYQVLRGGPVEHPFDWAAAKAVLEPEIQRRPQRQVVQEVRLRNWTRWPGPWPGKSTATRTTVCIGRPAVQPSMASWTPTVSRYSSMLRCARVSEVANARRARPSSQLSGAAWTLPGGSIARRVDVTEQTRSGQPEQADTWAHEAGCAYKSGDCERAMQLIVFAETLDPARQELWDQRRSQILARASQMPLDVQPATRRAAAGIAPDDPGLRQWAEWNRAMLSRQREAGQ
jgi:Bifunctional DNA primase/polymerase, N-terminal